VTGFTHTAGVMMIAHRKDERMICLHCNSEKFARKENALIEQAFRGETFMVKAPAMVCTKCGWQALAEGMADELLKSTGDAYRQRHGLLTSVEIKAIREDLGMSQQQFAEALGENGLTNTINGITEDDEIIVSVAYTKDDIELIQELEELIYQDDEEDDDDN